ncbi:MAG: hypothetical protein PHV13_01105 [Candidatus ainarchaeum sp.]|nr:hypothetical protein [Candidatus ainarchaeum sp.]
MGKEEFDAAAEEIKQLERKLLPYAPYSGEVSVERTLDLEPRDFVDLTYTDMLNMYERSEKIRSTVGLAVFKAAAGAPEKAVAAPPAPKPTAASAAIETRLKEMTTETLKMAEEVAKAPEKEEMPKPAEAQKPYEMEIEFEQKPAAEADLELEIEKPARKEEEPEKEPARRPEVAEPALELPAEKKVVVATVPPALRESPDEAAGRRYDQMEEQVAEMLGGAADEVSIKKKMLELTKELFKEKSINRREQIKLQISVMKNMLVGGVRRKKAAVSGEDAHGGLLETILGTQQAELAQTKDSIIDSYHRQIASIRKKFYDDIASVEAPEERKRIFDSFVFSVTSLVEQLPQVLKKYQDYTVKKHTAELEKVLESLGDKEKATAARADERLEYVKRGYDAEFAPVKGIIGRDIEALIDSAGSGVFEGEEGKEAKMMETVGEINATNEGTLLSYLRSKDPDFYRKYESKAVSRAEAIARAKARLAKEKGLSDSMIRKYFSGVENG